MTVSSAGIGGDYNHYRTAALSGTPDRAVSILTQDVVELLRQEGTYPTGDGDLGENISVDGVSFEYFQVGQRYQFTSGSKPGGESADGVLLTVAAAVAAAAVGAEAVVVEITEPIVPCANLCKLPFINDETLSPRDRIYRCQAFIERLGRADGFRGWYARVVQGGTIKIGDVVKALV